MMGISLHAGLLLASFAISMVECASGESSTRSGAAETRRLDDSLRFKNAWPSCLHSQLEVRQCLTHIRKEVEQNVLMEADHGGISLHSLSVQAMPAFNRVRLYVNYLGEMVGEINDGKASYPFHWNGERPGPWDCLGKSGEECCAMIQEDVTEADPEGRVLGCYIHMVPPIPNIDKENDIVSFGAYGYDEEHSKISLQPVSKEDATKAMDTHIAVLKEKLDTMKVDFEQKDEVTQSDLETARSYLVHLQNYNLEKALTAIMDEVTLKEALTEEQVDSFFVAIADEIEKLMGSDLDLRHQFLLADYDANNGDKVVSVPEIDMMFSTQSVDDSDEGSLDFVAASSTEGIMTASMSDPGMSSTHYGGDHSEKAWWYGIPLGIAIFSACSCCAFVFYMCCIPVKDDDILVQEKFMEPEGVEEMGQQSKTL